jgi:hypothetical protein
MNVECSSATLHLAHFVRDDRDLLNLEHSTVISCCAVTHRMP